MTILASGAMLLRCFVGDGLDVVDAVVDEEDLAVAGEFAGDGLLDAFGVPAQGMTRR